MDGHGFAKLLKSSSDLKEVKSQLLPKQKDSNFFWIRKVILTFQPRLLALFEEAYK